MSWNDCLYAYAQKHGGDYWGRGTDGWDGLLRTQYRGEPVLIRALATSHNQTELFYTLSAAFQITLERRYSCEIAPKSAVVQGVRAALGQVRKYAPQIPFGEDYGCPEVTEQRRIKTTDRPFTKRVLSSPELRRDLLELPRFGVSIDPAAPDSRVHQVQAAVRPGRAGGDVFPLDRAHTPGALSYEEHQPQIPEEFEPNLEKLLRLAWDARRAAAAWRMDAPGPGAG